MPVLPSPIDLWASNLAVRETANIRNAYPALRSWEVLKQLKVQSAFPRAMQDVLEQFKLPVLHEGRAVPDLSASYAGGDV